MSPDKYKGCIISRQFRTAIIRFSAVATLSTNLLLGSHKGEAVIYAVVIITYSLSGIASVTTERLQRKHDWLRSGFVMVDALLVAAVLYPHILGSPITDNHSLNTTALVVAFIMLNNVSLKKERRLLLIFSAASLSLWIGMLAVSAARHIGTGKTALFDALFNQDLGLAISFGFTALANYVLANDHERTRDAALKANMRRANLSRFFSPHVIGDLQERSPALELKRREVAVMFIDLRDFTSFAETASPSQLASTLAEYRNIVSEVVFKYGGNIDKFVGDGVMAVFGQPLRQAEDADRALACALRLVHTLSEWREKSDHDGHPALSAGIGLHYGAVVGGVLDSGRHLELTVIGDTVNVAQRLESLSKPLRASLVVSAGIVEQLKRPLPEANWLTRRAVSMRGRRLPIDIWYLPYTERPPTIYSSPGSLRTTLGREGDDCNSSLI
ncbi:adenylate/guanylate cyclase domain-containing protein [Gellertiella hungarica]|uniref:Adenylate cyclase n=1 Tax=Gellertiella hungarica TaxID=1572859 RepID=A0A7W6NMR4_9HYPH|nr:adenylate/guanylate cyclase domain-containing protein [Gellertiella hungarica]MBB4067268.1 adenylate cyclase [Gellertiella hungarica]